MGVRQDDRAFEQKAVEGMAGVVHLPAPGQGRRPIISVTELLVVNDGGGKPVFADVRLQLLGAVQMSPADLCGQLGRWVPGQPSRNAVECRCLDVVAMLIRLPPTKPGDLDLELVEHIPGGQHAVGDVRAVQPMMRDWGLRVVDPRHAVHEGRGAKRRFARQAKIEERRVGLRKPVAVGAGKLHEQVVRMLAINQRRPSIRGFSSRKEQRIAVRAHEGVG